MTRGPRWPKTWRGGIDSECLRTLHHHGYALRPANEKSRVASASRNVTIIVSESVGAESVFFGMAPAFCPQGSGKATSKPLDDVLPLSVILARLGQPTSKEFLWTYRENGHHQAR